MLRAFPPSQLQPTHLKKMGNPWWEIRHSLEQSAQTHAEAVTRASLLPLWRSSVGWVELSDLKGNFYLPLLSLHGECRSNGLIRWKQCERVHHSSREKILENMNVWLHKGHFWWSPSEDLAGTIFFKQIISHMLPVLLTLRPQVLLYPPPLETKRMA